MGKKLTFLSLLTIILTLGFSSQAVAKSYTIPIIRIDVAVQPDGTIQVTEHRTYNFDGSFSWADYRLPLEGYSAIRNIQVSENGQPFINENSEQRGTFIVQRSDDEIRVKWYYDAEDEKRTFTISYTLEEALVIGPQWVEFFWNYISTDREKVTDLLQIDFALPQSVARDSMYVWKRGASNQTNLTKTGNGYTVRATNLDDNQSVQIRAVFPRYVLNQEAVQTTNDDFTLALAQNDEETYQQELAEQRAREKQLAGYGRQLTVVISLLSVLIFVLVYQKYGKRHSARSVSSTETIMIPGSLKPAVAGWLINGRSINSGMLMATLLDLARRKYFIIREQEPENQWLGGEKKKFALEKSDSQPTGDLTQWEENLKNFVNKEIEEGNSQLDKLFSQSSYSASKWFSKWKKQLKKYCEDFDWYDEESYQGLYINLAVQIIFLCLSVLAILWAGPIGAIAMGLSFIMLMASFAIIRRTPEGEKIYKRWKAYKKGLKNAKNHSIKTELLDKHFIYAIAFGLSKDDIKNVFTESENGDVAFYWFVFYGTHPHSAAAVADTFSNLGASGAAAFPGATAGGAAGASAGAAGGGAAGGAG